MYIILKKVINMNIKSLKFMILVIPGIVLSFMSSNAYCMGTFKTGFHKLCKAVNVGITFYPWVEGIQNISNKKESRNSISFKYCSDFIC